MEKNPQQQTKELEVTNEKPTPFFGLFFFGGRGVGFLLKKNKHIMGGVFFGIFVSDEFERPIQEVTMFYFSLGSS